MRIFRENTKTKLSTAFRDSFLKSPFRNKGRALEDLDADIRPPKAYSSEVVPKFPKPKKTHKRNLRKHK